MSFETTNVWVIIIINIMFGWILTLCVINSTAMSSRVVKDLKAFSISGWGVSESLYQHNVCKRCNKISFVVIERILTHYCEQKRLMQNRKLTRINHKEVLLSFWVHVSNTSKKETSNSILKNNNQLMGSGDNSRIMLCILNNYSIANIWMILTNKQAHLISNDAN